MSFFKPFFFLGVELFRGAELLDPCEEPEELAFGAPDASGAPAAGGFEVPPLGGGPLASGGGWGWGAEEESELLPTPALPVAPVGVETDESVPDAEPDVEDVLPLPPPTGTVSTMAVVVGLPPAGPAPPAVMLPGVKVSPSP